MHNIKYIINHPEEFDDSMTKRGLGPIADELIANYKKHVSGKASLQELQERANFLAKEIGRLKLAKSDATKEIEESKIVKQQINALKQNEEEESDYIELDDLIYSLPNILDKDVPTGKDESDNIEIKRVGDIPKFSFTPKEHHILGEELNLMDFKQAAKISGSRFVLLKDELAQMERALANFMLDIHTQEFGYMEVSVPLLVRDQAMFASGQLPKFADDSFVTTDNYRLIPTSEVSLVNMVNDVILQADDLPLRYTAYTPCFRSEAGSAGKDTKGMIRMHQFNKVELVSITTEEDSKAEHEKMLSCAEEILKRLNLPYRIMLLCSGDTGFCATKTYDLEVWLPGQARYREISSCSNCNDFQARRLKARYNLNGKNIPVHTLNGSALAVGRTLIAIMENYQNEDGSITIPPALQKYMGKSEIKPTYLQP